MKNVSPKQEPKRNIHLFPCMWFVLFCLSVCLSVVLSVLLSVFLSTLQKHTPAWLVSVLFKLHFFAHSPKIG